MANIKVDGRWFTDRGAFGELKWSSRNKGGSEQASWRVDSTKRRPFRSGQRIDILEMGVPVWSGTTLEPDGDTLHARGLYYQGANAPGLDGSANATMVPDTAVSQGITAGFLDWSLPVSLSAVAVGDITTPTTVNEILDLWAAAEDKTWRVNPGGDLRAYSEPTDPKWHVTPGSAQLTLAEDSYASTIYANYLDSTTSLYTRVTVTNTSAADRFGPKGKTIDLHKEGTLKMTNAKATAIATTALSAASRPGWANSLRLASWELTTSGGAKANLRAVRGGDLIRIHGQMDMSIATGPLPYIDVVADEVEYEDGSDFIDIKPVGLQIRSLQGALDAALG